MSKEVTERYYVRRREFLNEDPDLPAFIIGIVEDTRAIPDDVHSRLMAAMEKKMAAKQK